MTSYNLKTTVFAAPNPRWVDLCAIDAVTDVEAIELATHVTTELFRGCSGEAVLMDWSQRIVWVHGGSCSQAAE